VQRGGMNTAVQLDSADLSLTFQGPQTGSSSVQQDNNATFLPILAALPGWLLLVVSTSSTTSRVGCLLHGLVSGVYPLFTLSLSPTPYASCEVFSAVLPFNNSIQSLSSSNCCEVLLSLHCPSSHDPLMDACLQLPATWQRDSFAWCELSGRLQLLVDWGLGRLQDSAISCGRRWRDACKVVLPKLSLLQGLLDSYQV